MNPQYISLAHGNGGRYMRELIEGLFAQKFSNGELNVDTDAARIELPSGEVMVSTDGFTVQPLEFPGGDIGSLAVHGTVNDLAVAGATPRYLTVNAFIEEGLPFTLLERVVESMARAAREARVQIVAGDTKVVPRGEASGLYLATTGIGIKRPELRLGMDKIQSGDRILVSGPVGDHGTAVMLAREQFGLKGDLQSDAASVIPLTESLHALTGLRFMRDPTRGGLATVAHEMSRATGLRINLMEQAIPVRGPVSSVCEILGYDPYYLACEGRVVAVLAAEQAERALALWRGLDQGQEAAIIGEFSEGDSSVILKTSLGGERYLDELEDDPLPRIC